MRFLTISLLCGAAAFGADTPSDKLQSKRACAQALLVNDAQVEAAARQQPACNCCSERKKKFTGCPCKDCIGCDGECCPKPVVPAPAAPVAPALSPLPAIQPQNQAPVYYYVPQVYYQPHQQRWSAGSC